MKLPKDLVGLKFDELLIIELNDFDVEMLLPAFFWMIRSGGKPRVEPTQRDPEDLKSRLIAHDRVCGFEKAEGQRVLGKWLRTSTFQTIRKGRGRGGREEVSYVKPLTFLAYKGPGAKSGNLRQTHLFVYDLLGRLGLSNGDSQTFRGLVQRSFAKGLELDSGAVKDGRYDGQEEVDLEVLLAMYFLDGLPGTRESTARAAKPSEPVCPFAAKVFAEDVVLFLTAYGNVLSPNSLARHLSTLLNFHFLLYTLSVFKGTNSLVEGAEAPEISRAQSASRLELYTDLTQDRAGRSVGMAQACVNRDLEESESFVRSSLLLRTVNSLVAVIPELQQRLKDLDGCDRIKALKDLSTEADVESDARAMLRKLKLHFSDFAEEDGELPEDINSLLSQGSSALDSAVSTLHHFQRKDAVTKMVRWIQWTGGLRRSDGFIEGNLKGRRIWRYSMSDSLLEVLCMVAAARLDVQEESGTVRQQGHGPRPILMSAFLGSLKSRYGILVAEPPSFESGSESVASAKENLGALRRRLRQMGLFQDLSDDFNAQRIEPRYPTTSAKK